MPKPSSAWWTRRRTGRTGPRGKLGRLDVGVYGSAIFGIVPNILARFSRENPDVEIAL